MGLREGARSTPGIQLDKDTAVSEARFPQFLIQPLKFQYYDTPFLTTYRYLRNPEMLHVPPSSLNQLSSFLPVADASQGWQGGMKPVRANGN